MAEGGRIHTLGPKRAAKGMAPCLVLETLALVEELADAKRG
jgi:hypothetical protein